MLRLRLAGLRFLLEIEQAFVSEGIRCLFSTPVPMSVSAAVVGCIGSMVLPQELAWVLEAAVPP